MRFVLDEDVDAGAVGTFLRRHGNECWSVIEAGLGGADDDAVAIYADDHDAALITHDAEATRRRRRFTFGRHVFLRCHQLEADALLEKHLNELLDRASSWRWRLRGHPGFGDVPSAALRDRLTAHAVARVHLAAHTRAVSWTV